jgi:hypothetical protein
LIAAPASFIDGARPKFFIARPVAEDAGVKAGIRSRVRRERFPKAPFTNITAIGVVQLSGFEFELKVIARVPSES